MECESAPKFRRRAQALDHLAVLQMALHDLVDIGLVDKGVPDGFGIDYGDRRAGTHDDGRGELEDLLQVIRQAAPQGPLALAGFSFGAFVTANAMARLTTAATPRVPEQLVLVGTATSRFTVDPVAPDWHARTLVVHGEEDDVVPLASVMDWARPQSLPVTVVPGVGHFFHGQLPLLRQIVLRHLQSAPVPS